MPSSTSIYDRLFSKKMVWVSGKGGVGKSTLVYHLAKQAVVQREMEVLILSVGNAGFFEDLVISERDRKRLLLGEKIKLFPGAHIQVLQNYESFLEFLNSKFKIPKALVGLLRKKWLEQVFLALPGLTPTVLTGKICFEAKRAGTPGLHQWVIVEAPPIGQLQMYLSISKHIKTLFKFGPLHKDAVQMEKMLQNDDLTELLLVTLLDDLPVEETLAYVEEHPSGLSLHSVVCNRVLFPDLLPQGRATPELKEHPVGYSLWQRELPNYKALKATGLELFAFEDQPNLQTGSLKAFE
jgi:hypothetical protein